MLLAIDPGLSTGWAVFTPHLQSCGMGDPPDLKVHHLIIEKPQVYPHTPTAQANNLITLAFQAGQYVGSIQHKALTVVLPHVWKGTLPKPIHHLRIWKALDDAEKATVLTLAKGVSNYLQACEVWVTLRRKTLPGGKECDMMDAIGLGLYALNRLRP